MKNEMERKLKLSNRLKALLVGVSACLAGLAGFLANTESIVNFFTKYVDTSYPVVDKWNDEPTYPHLALPLVLPDTPPYLQELNLDKIQQLNRRCGPCYSLTETGPYWGAESDLPAPSSEIIIENNQCKTVFLLLSRAKCGGTVKEGEPLPADAVKIEKDSAASIFDRGDVPNLINYRFPPEYADIELEKGDGARMKIFGHCNTGIKIIDCVR